MVIAEMLQHVVVTLAAFAALAVIARRVLGFVGVRERQRGCSNCASSKTPCAPQVASVAQPTTHRAVLVRPTPR